MVAIPPEDMVWFAVVVDGELVHYLPAHKTNEMFSAILRSSPIFIEVPHDARPQLGSTWDGESFTSPEE